MNFYENNRSAIQEAALSREPYSRNALALHKHLGNLKELGIEPEEPEGSIDDVLNRDEWQYMHLLSDTLVNGVRKGDRTGTGTYSRFGGQLHFDLSKGFPLLTTKKVFTKGITHELLWLMAGDTNIQYLTDNDVDIWDAWANEQGDLGPLYGAQWRDWKNPDGTSVDQLAELVNGLRTNPDSRRHIISAWNPSYLPNESISPQENVAQGKMALAPCHTLIQMWVADGKLQTQLYQRSADEFLGVPFNIASYAILTHMVGQVIGCEPDAFIHSFGDRHIYTNHVEQVRRQLARAPKDTPRIILPQRENITQYRFEDVEIKDYRPSPGIKAPIAI